MSVMLPAGNLKLYGGAYSKMLPLASGSTPPPPDPLAGLTFALRLQTHAGFGATPNGALGLYKPATNAQVQFTVATLDPSADSLYQVTIDGGLTFKYLFSTSTPGPGFVYLGGASGTPATDAATLTNAINTNQSSVCVAIAAVANVSVQSNSTGVGSSVEVVDPDSSTHSSTGADVSPATTNGDALTEGRDPLSGTGTVLSQSNNALMGVLRFDGSTPYIRFDGSQWYNLIDLSSLTEGELFLLFSNDSDGSYVYQISSASDDHKSFIPYTDGKIYDAFGTTARKNAIDASFGAGWNIYNAYSKNGEWRCSLNGSELFSTGSNTASFPASAFLGKTDLGNWPGGKLIALFILPLVLDPSTRSDVFNFLNDSLKPS